MAGDVREDGGSDGGGVLQTPEQEGCGICGGHGEGDVGDLIASGGVELIEGTREFEMLANGDAISEREAGVVCQCLLGVADEHWESFDLWCVEHVCENGALHDGRGVLQRGTPVAKVGWCRWLAFGSA